MRRIQLRRPGTCSVCLVAVSVGDDAIWDSDRKTVTCIACSGETNTAPTAGVAGGSAQAKGMELREKQLERRRQLRDRRPILGRLQIAIAGPATQGDSWSKGAVGEQKFGAALDGMHDQGVLALHDRRIPGSRANIDHIAVAASGVWVIDAKRYSGLVTKVDKGGWFRSDVRLTVAGRDRTKLVDGVLKQVAHVQRALEQTPLSAVAIHGALCFVDAEFRLFAKPFEVRGVLVSWGKVLRERIAAPGEIGRDERAALQRHLSRAFAPAT